MTTDSALGDQAARLRLDAVLEEERCLNDGPAQRGKRYQVTSATSPIIIAKA